MNEETRKIRVRHSISGKDYGGRFNFLSSSFSNIFFCSNEQNNSKMRNWVSGVGREGSGLSTWMGGQKRDA